MSYILIVIRWILVIPTAYLASFLLTRFYLFFLQYQINSNILIDGLFVQIVSGYAIAATAIYVAPNGKKIAYGISIGLSLLISTAYFAKFNDIAGGLLAAAHLVSTVISGLLLLGNLPATQKTKRGRLRMKFPIFNRQLKRMLGQISGELGTITNPICCEDPSGEKNYLFKLRDRHGKRPEFERLGSVSPNGGAYGNLLDLYRVSTPFTPPQDIHMDMYHKGYREQSAINGYVLSSLIVDHSNKIPPIKSASQADLRDFGFKVRKYSKNDAISLHSILNQRYTIEMCTKIISTAYFLVMSGDIANRERVVNSLSKYSEYNLQVADADIVYSFVTGL